MSTYEELIDRIEAARKSKTTADVDFLIQLLSHGNTRVRRGAVAALGEIGNRRAVEPLIFCLTKEFSESALFSPLIIDTVAALAQIPDNRALLALKKIASQMISADEHMSGKVSQPSSDGTRASQGGRMPRVVARDVHSAVLTGIQQISDQLGSRQEKANFRAETLEEKLRKLDELQKVLEQEERLLKEARQMASPVTPEPRPPDEKGVAEAEYRSLVENEQQIIDHSEELTQVERELERQIRESLRQDEDVKRWLAEARQVKERRRVGAPFPKSSLVKQSLADPIPIFAVLTLVILVTFVGVQALSDAGAGAFHGANGTVNDTVTLNTAPNLPILINDPIAGKWQGTVSVSGSATARIENLVIVFSKDGTYLIFDKRTGSNTVGTWVKASDHEYMMIDSGSNGTRAKVVHDPAKDELICHLYDGFTPNPVAYQRYVRADDLYR